jgi:WD40 repeat protein
MRTLRPILWFFKIVVLPITATTTALYFLCLYLLKDAELLEAQRNRAEPGTRDPDEESPFESRISFTTMPRASSTDIELITASNDGRVIASVGMQNELVIVWRKDHDRQTHISIDTTDVLLRAASTSAAASTITALAVDEKGVFCAVGTGAGVIAVWSIEDGRVTSLTHLALENSSSGIVELQFIPTTNSASLLATYENGAAAKWIIDGIYPVTYLTPVHSGRIIKCMALRVQSDNRVLVAFAMQD